MKIIDAYWEKRNLGVSTIEISVDVKDDIDEVRKALVEADAEYIVAKVASGAVDKMILIQECGYHFVEASIFLEGKLSRLETPEIYRRYEDKMSMMIADKSLTRRVLEEVEQGKIFKTDRIAMDSYFSQKLAGRRYSYWIQDELEKGASIYISLYKETPVLFAIVKQVGGTVYNSFLGGVFESEANKGLGFSGLPMLQKVIGEKGGTKITTHISSNNLPILRLHMDFGYEIKAMDNVFVKHKG